MFKKLLIGIVLLLLFIFFLFQFKVLWPLAPYYSLQQPHPIPVPIMDMNAYEEIWETHRRPYIYSLEASNGGRVCIVGIDHTKDPNNPQIDSIRYYWESFNPTVALVEGRVGNLFTWLQDPIETLGEGGLVTQLANRKGIPLYSWESKKEEEIQELLQEFTKEEVAMFYTFRPYFSNSRYETYEHPEQALQEYLDSRTDVAPLKGVFSSWTELDQKWQQDFPGIEWRNYGAGKSYPDGYLQDIWNRNNIMRDEHMVQTIVELVQNKNQVFVTMGSSHAPRIEATLKAMIETIN